MKLFQADVELGDAITIGNMSVYPLIGEDLTGPAYLTGPEAAEADLMEVSELDPPQVPYLRVHNRAEVPLLLVEGEMLIGGDQNRTMNVTILAPPKEWTTVPVSCVEAGRWGVSGRRAVEKKLRFAPGSLRRSKVAYLEERIEGSSSRRLSDQGLVWGEVDRLEAGHAFRSGTSALEDVQEKVETEAAPELDRVAAQPHQIGVVCVVGDEVIGLDLFDRSATLSKYLRSIVGGHVLDARESKEAIDPVGAIERFLAKVDAASCERGQGVGLGDEVLLQAPVTGVGLEYEGSLVHVAAFPESANDVRVEGFDLL